MRRQITCICLGLALAACRQAPTTPEARLNVAPVAERPLYRLLQADAPGDAPLVEADAGDRVALAVTVYHENMGLVADTRAVLLPSGEARLRFTDVPSQLDGRSASLREPMGEAVRVLEQIFAFDVITPDKLLERFLGQQIEIRRPGGERVLATVVGLSGGLVVRIGEAIHLEPPGEVILPALPEGMSARPTLEWRLQLDSAGDRRLAATYQTGGLSWQADYTLQVREMATEGHFSGWASVTNTSGIDYPQADITLVAGDPNQASPPPLPLPATAGAERADTGAFTQEPLDIFHSFRLERPATLGHEETKQLPLFAPTRVAFERIFRFDGARVGPYGEGDRPVPVEVELKLANTAANGLGLPLPRGRVRIEQLDETGAPTLLGEDAVPHVPEGETLTIRQGRAFDVVGDRDQTAVEQVSERVRRESYEVTLRNHMDAPVTVTVVERLFGDWEILRHSHPFERESANAIRFQVPVPADGEATLTYTAQITH